MMIFWMLLFLLGYSFPTAAHAASDALAEVDGVTITSEEVEKSLAGQLSKLEGADLQPETPETRRADQ